MQIFVSRVTEDEARVKAIVEPMSRFVRPWVDSKGGIGLGDARGDELRRAVVEESHAIVVFLSAVALRKPWVANGVGWALEHERILQKRRRSEVKPVLLEPLDLARAGAPFDRLHDKLHLPALDPTADGLADASRRLGEYLFQWANDWMDVVEPQGGNRRFVARLNDRRHDEA